MKDSSTSTGSSTGGTSSGAGRRARSASNTGMSSSRAMPDDDRYPWRLEVMDEGCVAAGARDRFHALAGRRDRHDGGGRRREGLRHGGASLRVQTNRRDSEDP